MLWGDWEFLGWGRVAVLNRWVRADLDEQEPLSKNFQLMRA